VYVKLRVHVGTDAAIERWELLKSDIPTALIEEAKSDSLSDEHCVLGHSLRCLFRALRRVELDASRSGKTLDLRFDIRRPTRNPK
jgi:hypothetical protein